MTNDLETAFNEIAETKALPREVVLEALQTALVSAYRRDSGASSAQRVEARIDPSTGRVRIFVEKEVVDDLMNPSTEVTLEKARFYEPEADMGDTVMVQVEGSTKRFGRIAAQTAKQVILQKIREAERNSLYEEFADREGDLITGTVQSVNSSVVTLSLGRAEAILPRNQQIPGERYRPHEKLRTYCLEVKKTNRGPQIVVSRSHRNMLRRLLEYEVPEIFNGQVEIKNIAREAGYRSKVAVAALQDGIDPVGACVGMRGIRIQNIVKELHDEKIDVIEWNPNQEQFIAKALSPARVTGVYLDDDPDGGRTAVVVVPDDQLSLAIGREGQNARLAAKLTGWRIDIKSVTEAVSWALDNLTLGPLTDIENRYGDMVEDARRILDKKNDNRTVMPEEYNALGRFADLVERRLLEEREVLRQQRREEIGAVKATLPEHTFNIPITELELPQEVIDALQPLETAGEIMLRILIDEDRVRRLLSKLPEDTLNVVQEALDRVMFPDAEDIDFETDDEEDAVAEEPVAETVEEPVEVAEEPVVEVEDDSVDEPVAEVVAVAETDAPEDSTVLSDDDVQVLRDAFGGRIVVEETRPQKQAEPHEEAHPETAQEAAEEPDFEALVDYYDDDDDDDELGGKSKKKKSRQKKRQLIYDEDAGKVVSKRRRKGNRKRDKWDDYEY